MAELFSLMFGSDLWETDRMGINHQKRICHSRAAAARGVTPARIAKSENGGGAAGEMMKSAANLPFRRYFAASARGMAGAIR